MFTTAHSTIARAVLGTVGTALCAGVCLVAATAPAAAATTTLAEHRTVTVSVADLDLRHAAGRAVLDRRVAIAAREVCVSADTGLAARAVQARCVRAAIAGAKPVVG